MLVANRTGLSLSEGLVQGGQSCWWMLSIISRCSVDGNSRIGVRVVSVMVGEFHWCRDWTVSSSALSLIAEIVGTGVLCWLVLLDWLSSL